MSVSNGLRHRKDIDINVSNDDHIEKLTALPVSFPVSTSTVTSATQNKINKSKKHVDINKFLESARLDFYQIIICCLFNIVVLANHYIGNPFFQKFFTLSYKYPNVDSYDIGFDDSYFIIFWIVNLLFLRSALITFVFKPLAKLMGITKFAATQRFIEQTWSIFYYSISWGCGFYLYYKSSYFFNCYNIYANWPHDHMDRQFKTYYLIQTACWFQQFIVLHIEKRRKDHYQMLSHHIVTCLLCVGSYRFYFTRIGHVILLCMDFVDITLSTAKILKYGGLQTICDVMFGFFMLSWIVLRHGCYNYVLWFSWAKARNIMNGYCNSSITSQKICYEDWHIDIFIILLASLQVIMCFWMYMIIRVAVKVVTGGAAEDVRSDSESE